MTIATTTDIRPVATPVATHDATRAAEPAVIESIEPIPAAELVSAVGAGHAMQNARPPGGDRAFLVACRFSQAARLDDYSPSFFHGNEVETVKITTASEFEMSRGVSRSVSRSSPSTYFSEKSKWSHV